MPHTIAENLARLQAAKTAIGSAIAAKGGTVGVSDGLEDFPTDIASIPVGIFPAESNDINFYDYDGTILYSYTAAEFINLTALPPNPSHTGLTALGWNWTLSDAKAYVASYGMLDIGQNYMPTSGNTEIHISLTENRLEPYLSIYCVSPSDFIVDWGDGSQPSSYSSGSEETVYEGHTYQTTGNYIISIKLITGGIQLTGDDSKSFLSGNSENTQINSGYMSTIKKLVMGLGVQMGVSMLDNARSVTKVTGGTPSGVFYINESCFNGCFSLPHFTLICDDIPVWSVQQNAFYKCYSLRTVSLNKSVRNIYSNAFDSCTSLSRITIPNTVVSIGDSVFNKCYSLHDVVIPSSVISIGASAFSNCRSLSSIHIPSSVTSIGSNAFSNCGFLSTIYIDQPTGSISGAPWGASNDTQIIWNDT